MQTPLVDRIRRAIEYSPELFVTIARASRRTEHLKKRVVWSGTDIVVESYPRSASSFAVRALRRASSRPISIATHTHSPAHVQAAIGRGKPVLVIVREPRAAILSMMAFARQAVDEHQSSKLHRASRRPAKQLIHDYVWFHERLYPHVGQISVATFEEVTDDFSAVLNRLNARFNTDFDPSAIDGDARNELLEKSFHIGPDQHRNDIKVSLEESLNLHRTQLELATQTYTRFLDAARQASC